MTSHSAHRTPTSISEQSRRRTKVRFRLICSSECDSVYQMPTYTYENAVAYRQSRDPSAPWLVSFVVTAEQLLEWAGIPRRSESGMIGFQRAYDPLRVQRAQEFFSLGINQSPTALVVGLHPSSHAKSSAKLTFKENPGNTSIVPCTLTIEYDAEAMTAGQAAKVVKDKLAARLQESAEDDENDAVDGNVFNGDDNSIRADDEDELEDPDDGGIGDDRGDATDLMDEIEIGKSMIASLHAHLDDEIWCEANADALIDLAKPATIIDGQHRVKGAEHCERNIPFSVCAIFECSWPEQVFQFTVVNYTAKGIPDQFITANAALSLTERELKTLEERLVQARVKVVEYEIMKVVQFDAGSPFYSMVNLSEKKDPSKIGYKTMVRVARAWYSPRSQFFKYILAQLYPNQSTHGHRVKEWKDGDWGDFFCAFWSAIREHYGNHESHVQGYNLWDVGYSNLIISVVLLQFQDILFEHCDQQDEDYWEIPSGTTDRKKALIGKIMKRVEKNLPCFPADFFAMAWKTKSLNTSLGRQALTDAFAKLMKKKGTYQYARSALVTGKTGS